MTDRYLDDKECIDRLMNEWRTHGSIILCYDYDNCVFDFHNRGDKFDKVIALIRKAKELGCTVIVFTSCDESRFEEIKKYLRDNNIPFDGINENAKTIPYTGRKLYYNILLDDRAGLSASYAQLKEVLLLIELNKKADLIKNKQDIDA